MYCNLLDRADIETLSKSKEVWSCLRCNSEIFPFNSNFANSDDEEILVPQPDPVLKPFFLAANSSISENDQNLHEKLVDKIDCRYFDCNEFNKSFSNPQDLSFLHLNIASLAKRLDNFTNLPNSLYHQFKIIGISETRISSQSIAHNLNHPGYTFHLLKLSLQLEELVSIFQMMSTLKYVMIYLLLSINPNVLNLLLLKFLLIINPIL